MKNYQRSYGFFVILILVFAPGSCNTSTDNEDAFVVSDTIKPPVWVSAGEPDVHHLSDKEPPKAIDLSTKSAPARITADFYIPMRNFNTEHGLALGSIRSGFKDKSGNLWFGTFGNGVSKYDGKSFTNYNMSNGLIHNYIETIAQDNEGNMWFGSYGGASKYNGVFFENFTTADGLQDNRVFKILEDSRGNIWFATPGGLSLYKPDTNDTEKKKFITYNDKHGLTGNYARDVIEDQKGNLWIAGIKGVFKFTPHTVDKGDAYFSDMAEITGLANRSLYCMAEDSEGTLWFGTSEGVVRFDQAAVEGEKPSVIEYGLDDGLISNTITSILEDRGGSIWFGSEGGASEYIKKDSLFINYTTQNGLSDNFIVCMVEDKAGSLWFGTKGNGLCRFDGKSTIEYTAKQGLPDKMLYTLVGNKNNDLWIGTENGTITKFAQRDKNQGSLLNFSNVQGLKEDDILNMIFDSKGNLWYGSDYGLSRYSHNSVIQTWDTAHGLNNNSVISLKEDRNGNIWFGTFNGGMSRFDGYTFSNYTTEQGLVHNTVWNIYEDNSGAFWFATRGGLSRFDGENFINFTTDQGLPDNKLSVLKQDKAGNLLIGTWGGGVSIIRKKWMEMMDTKNTSLAGKKIFENYNTSHGLPNDVVYGILEDKDENIIIGTSYGFTILKGGLSENKEFIAKAGVEIYNQQTGYPIKDISNNYTMIIDTAGLIWAGTGKKLIRFDANEIQRNKKPPEVIIQHVNINHEKISWHSLQSAGVPKSEFLTLSNIVPAYVNDELNVFGKKLNEKERDSLISKFRKVEFDKISPFNAIPENLVLPFTHNSISFDFLGIETTKPYLVRYQFMLEGSDEKWSPLSSRTTVEYSNLWHGSYTFKLRAIGPEGLTSQTTRFNFKILPPWWFSWWSITLYILFIFITIMGTRHYEMKRIMLKNELKIEKVTSDSLRNLDQLKSNFFANISHELRTPLTLILGEIESVLSTEADKSKKDKLHVADRNAKRLLKLINELLDLSKLESGSMVIAASSQNIVSFLKSLFFSFEAFAYGKKIELVFESKTEHIPVYFDPDKMEIILNNLLSNAFKFTPENGRISVIIGVDNDKMVQIHVRDNGIGIPADKVTHIFDRFYQVDGSDKHENEGTGIGLSLTKELVELHNGKIIVNSLENKGTEFIISLPLDAKEYENADIGEGVPKITISTPKQVGSISPPIEELKKPQTTAVEKNENTELILVVEDNEDVRSFISENLVENYQVLEACNGEEGLQMAQRDIPDLIISDVMMPKMDGYQLCQALRKNEKTSHIPIIMLTAKAGLDDKINGLETGVDAYLTKPFNTRELKANVKNLIHQRIQLRKRFSKSTVIRPSEVSVVSADQEFLNKILKIVETHFEDEHFSVEELASHVNMSVSQLNRKLKALVDQPPGQLIRSFRLQRAADLIAQRAGTVSEICYKVGFTDNAYFSRAFRKQFSCSPSDFNKQTV